MGTVGEILFLSSPKIEVLECSTSFFRKLHYTIFSQPSIKEGFLLPNIVLNHIAAMIDLIGSFIIAADAWTGNIQNEMDARYVEQSSLTNLFTEHKFWGWAGLLLIFVAIATIFYFQFQEWEQEDQEQK